MEKAQTNKTIANYNTNILIKRSILIAFIQYDVVFGLGD